MKEFHFLLKLILYWLLIFLSILQSLAWVHPGPPSPPPSTPPLPCPPRPRGASCPPTCTTPSSSAPSSTCPCPCSPCHTRPRLLQPCHPPPNPLPFPSITSCGQASSPCPWLTGSQISYPRPNRRRPNSPRLPPPRRRLNPPQSRQPPSQISRSRWTCPRPRTRPRRRTQTVLQAWCAVPTVNCGPPGSSAPGTNLS